jgi:hypothetical protein
MFAADIYSPKAQGKSSDSKQLELCRCKRYIHGPDAVESRWQTATLTHANDPWTVSTMLAI